MIKKLKVKLCLFSSLALMSCADGNVTTQAINTANTSNTTDSVSNTISTDINPLDYPKLSVAKTNSPTDGEILISPYKIGDKTTGNIMVLDKMGNIIRAKKTNAETLNFEKWNLDGKIRYSYLEHEPSPNSVSNGISNVPGSIVVTDENFNEIKRIRLLPNNGRTINDPDEVDAHDFVLIDDNHYIVLSYYVKTVSNIPVSLNPAATPTVIAALIQEVKDDQVIFEWDSTTHPELYQESKEGNTFNDATIQNDYAHLNSMIIDPKDDNLICSFRNLSEVLKIDRKTGNIIWKLGGTNSDFPLTDDQKFYFQHNVTLTDNNQTLLMFDNGSATDRPYTRINEFQLDEVNKKVTSFKTFRPSETIFSQYMGSVQKRGDTYFIGWGSVPRVSEINYKTGEFLFDMNMDLNSYRAFKY